MEEGGGDAAVPSAADHPHCPSTQTPRPATVLPHQQHQHQHQNQRQPQPQHHHCCQQQQQPYHHCRLCAPQIVATCFAAHGPGCDGPWGSAVGAGSAGVAVVVVAAAAQPRRRHPQAAGEWLHQTGHRCWYLSEEAAPHAAPVAGAAAGVAAAGEVPLVVVVVVAAAAVDDDGWARGLVAEASRPLPSCCRSGGWRLRRRLCQQQRRQQQQQCLQKKKTAPPCRPKGSRSRFPPPAHMNVGSCVRVCVSVCVCCAGGARVGGCNTMASQSATVCVAYPEAPSHTKRIDACALLQDAHTHPLFTHIHTHHALTHSLTHSLAHSCVGRGGAVAIEWRWSRARWQPLTHARAVFTVTSFSHTHTHTHTHCHIESHSQSHYTITGTYPTVDKVLGQYLCHGQAPLDVLAEHPLHEAAHLAAIVLPVGVVVVVVSWSWSW